MKKILSIIMLCLTIVASFPNTFAYASEDYVEDYPELLDYFYYDEETYEICYEYTTSDGQKITARQVLDDGSIANVERGYGLTIIRDVINYNSTSKYANLKLYAYTYPRGVHLGYSSNSYNGTSDSNTLGYYFMMTKDIGQISIANKYSSYLPPVVSPITISVSIDIQDPYECRFGVPTSFSFSDGSKSSGYYFIYRHLLDPYNYPEIIMYSTDDVYYLSGSAYTPIYEGTNQQEYDEEYTFEEWCSDAGLSCSASSNEVNTVVPFWYNNEYEYLVRKDTSGNLYCTMIQNPLDKIKAMLSGSLYLYNSAADNLTITVRNFVYDTDGWRLLQKDDATISAFQRWQDTNCIIDSTRVLLYTSVHIGNYNNWQSLEYVKSSCFDDTYIEKGSSSSGNTEEWVSTKITSNVAFLYAEPSKESHYVCALGQDKIIFVSSMVVDVDSNMWFKAKYVQGDDIIYEGYVQATDIYLGVLEKEEEEDSQDISLQGVIANGIAAVFNEPLVEEEVIDYIAAGTSVTVSGSVITGTDGNKFYLVYYNDGYNLSRGYVQAEYVSFNIGGSGNSGNSGGSNSSGNGNIEWADGSEWSDITLDNVKDKAEELKGGIGEILSFVISVPVIIANLFSFLPDWCLTILGISFTLAGILLVIKLIRG